MAISAARVSLEEYLNTDYEPDCDYVDGVLEDRNAGKKKHARTQTRLAAWLGARGQLYGYEALVELRTKVSATRVRVPDICLVSVSDQDEITQNPPLLCIEVLSPEDRWSRIEARLRDYLAFGVPTVWAIDPYARKGWVGTQETAIAEITDGVLRCADLNLEVALSEILPEE
jgi:Uma2 family endonuclease